MTFHSRFGTGGGLRALDSSFQNLLKPFCLMALVVLTATTLVVVDDVDAEADVTELRGWDYYSLGMTFNVDLGADFYYVTPGFGLYIEGNYLKGELTATGICEVSSHDKVAMHSYYLLVPYELDDNGCVVSDVAGPIQLNWGLNVAGAYHPSIDDGSGPYLITPDNSQKNDRGYYFFTIFIDALIPGNYPVITFYDNLLAIEWIYPYEVDFDEQTIGLEIVDIETTYGNEIESNWVPTILVSDDKVWGFYAECLDDYDEDFADCFSIPEREGYVFKGWDWTPTTNEEWMTTDINWDGELNPAKIVYAQWEKLESPFTATSGSGTEEDPYSGTLTTTTALFDAEYVPSEIWVEIGTEFSVIAKELGTTVVVGDLRVDVDSGFGLSHHTLNTQTYITGVASSTGDCTIAMYEDSSELWRTEVHIVGKLYPDLTFESDPVADGIVAWVATKT